MHDGTTDVWVVMDGVNVRGAVVLAETPKSLTLVTVAGNLSPVDLLHLRGHFGIPRFEATICRPARGERPESTLKPRQRTDPAIATPNLRMLAFPLNTHSGRTPPKPHANHL